MNPRILLRVEGLAVGVAAVGAYLALGGPLWLLAVLALAPDLSMVGYLAGPRVGAAAYNAAHTYIAPVALAALATGFDVPIALLGALVWAGHIGVDRLFGYGLKYESGFKDTHLGHAAATREVVPDPAGSTR